jgi:hypothetical protein
MHKSTLQVALDSFGKFLSVTAEEEIAVFSGSCKLTVYGLPGVLYYPIPRSVLRVSLVSFVTKAHRVTKGTTGTRRALRVNAYLTAS